MFLKNYLTRAIGLVTLTTAATSIPYSSYANIYDEHKKTFSAVATIANSDRVIAVLDVNREQTAQTPKDIGEARLAVMMEQAAAQTVLDTARSVASLVEDTTPGRGLSRSATCTVMKEHENHVKKHDLSTKVRHAIAKSKAATYYQKEGDKRRLRASDHYANYCDISEAKYGNCLLAPNSKAGMNVDYGNIANNMTLTENQINAGYSYINNIIDPSKTDLSKCTTSVCNALKTEEAQYHAIGSAIQNAFLQQMQDSIAYDEPPDGIKTITVEQLGELSAPWDGNLAAWDEQVVTGGNMLVITNLDEATKALLRGIHHGEASSPNAYNNGQDCDLSKSESRGDGSTIITQMTPQQILDRYNTQGNYKSGNVSCDRRLFAVGLYQFIPSTLNQLLQKYPQYRHKPFTEEVQLMFALDLLRGNKTVKAFLDGKSNDIDAVVHDISKIWSSVPVPAGKKRSDGTISNGAQSYYGSGNKANMESGRMIRHALEQMRKLRS